MGFFSELNFTRSVILVSLVGSAVLGYVVYDKMQQLEQLEQQVDTRAPLLVQDIQTLAVVLNNLNAAVNLESLQGEQPDAETYVRGIAQRQAVEIGNVNISPSSRTLRQGVEDRMWRIEPAEKKREFRLANISNFLYRMEEKSRRVKVTSLRIEPVQRLREDEIGKDRQWTFEAQITSRQAVSGS